MIWILKGTRTVTPLGQVGLWLVRQHCKCCRYTLVSSSFRALHTSLSSVVSCHHCFWPVSRSAKFIKLCVVRVIVLVVLACSVAFVRCSLFFFLISFLVLVVVLLPSLAGVSSSSSSSSGCGIRLVRKRYTLYFCHLLVECSAGFLLPRV